MCVFSTTAAVLSIARLDLNIIAGLSDGTVVVLSLRDSELHLHTQTEVHLAGILQA